MSSPSTSLPVTTVGSSGNPLVDALLGQAKWGGAVGSGIQLTFSFPWTTSADAVFDGANGQPYSPLGEELAPVHLGLDATQQAAARQVLQAWSNVANVRFQEVADAATAVGDVRIAFTSVAQTASGGSAPAWGWAALPNAYWPAAGDIWLSSRGSARSDSGWQSGGSNFELLLHEVGHALGLKHTFEGGVTLDAATDTDQYSVMSYTHAGHNLFIRLPSPGSPVTAANVKLVYADTPMPLDIQAAQYLYGANTSYHAGNDVYTFDPDQPFFRTLWDAGGNDAISVANFIAGCTIDLRPGHFSSITIKSDLLGSIGSYDGTNNLAIADGATIEQAVGGSGDDTLIASDSGSRLEGGSGNDVLVAGPGASSLDGGGGIDTAVFSGARAQYSISRGQDAVLVANAGVVDTLTGIERLQFADRVVALDPSSVAGQAFRLYQAAFDRSPDASGLGYWVQVLDKGTSLVTVADAFASSGEFHARYGSLTCGDFVRQLYENVLHRAPDAGGDAFWAAQLGAGQLTHGQVLAGFSESSENQAALLGVIQDGISYARI